MHQTRSPDDPPGIVKPCGQRMGRVDTDVGIGHLPVDPSGVIASEQVRQAEVLPLYAQFVIERRFPGRDRDVFGSRRLFSGARSSPLDLS